VSQKLDELKAILSEVMDLQHAASLLEWDQQTYMPRAGAEARGHQLATLHKLAQVKFTSGEVGQLIADARAESSGADADSDSVALVRVTARDYDKAVRVPPEFVARRSMVTAAAHEAWVDARRAADFGPFRPHLERILELVKEYAAFFPGSAHPYDALLDDFEPGMKTADVRGIFDALRPQQVELIRQIREHKPPRDDFLYGKYDQNKLMDFAVMVATDFGYDWNRGRQDRAPHPFATSFSVDDVRITTRFEPQAPINTLFNTFHESGHGIYEQGISRTYERSLLKGGCSSALHESQSRLWENIVGRSLPFWEHYFPKFKQRFAGRLDGVGLKAFHRAINRVQPSFIRVEADEATYNLHIMLRLELELALLEGQLAVKDLPDAWNTRMRDYLGITPPNDAQGVLQDIHWSGMLFGYFPTYALGNLVSAQLWTKILSEIPDLDGMIRKGDFAPLREWLRVNLHTFGRKYDPGDLVRKITGSGIDAAPYMQYLQGKYAEIYNL